MGGGIALFVSSSFHNQGDGGESVNVPVATLTGVFIGGLTGALIGGLFPKGPKPVAEAPGID